MFKYIKNFFNANISFLILLTIVVFALYGKSVNFELTGLDDDILISKNINFISNYKNIPKLFIMSALYDKESLYYRPILSLSFAIESFFVRDNLKLYHLTNIILFVLCLYLFYLFCLELKLNPLITKFVLLLIAVHPMFSSVVVWIPGRNDSLLTFFFISSFVCFIRYINTQKIKYAILFYLFFVLSLFTKETFILLIPLYFVYLLLYKSNFQKKKIIYIFISLIPFILIFFILRQNSVITFDYQYYITNINVFFVNFFKDTFVYFYNFLIPEYIPIMLLNPDLNLKVILYNCLFFFLLGFILYKKILSIKTFIFSFLLILLSLFPTFLLTKYDVYLNHRFFLCSLGFLIIFVSISNFFIIKFNKIKIIFLLSFCIFFTGFFVLSYSQANKYKNYETFWINAYLDSPDYYITNQNLFRIYRDRGMLKEAEYYIKRTIELEVSYSTLIDYVSFLIETGNLEEAETGLLKMDKDIKRRKDVIYYALSGIYYKNKDYEKALLYALKAYNIIPYDIGYCKRLIKIYDIMKNYDEELKIYENLLSYDKENKDYKNKIVELEEKIKNKETGNA